MWSTSPASRAACPSGVEVIAFPIWHGGLLGLPQVMAWDRDPPPTPLGPSASVLLGEPFTGSSFHHRLRVLFSRAFSLAFARHSLGSSLLSSWCQDGLGDCRV